MSKEQVIHIIIHSLKDSLIALAIVFAVYVILSLVEVKVSKRISKDSKLSPIFGSLFGLIPQCGVSVVASDMYLKRHITMGTLVAIFLSCSDEALPLLLASHNEKSLVVIPLVIIKFIIGFVIGFTLDLLIKDKQEVVHHLEECHHHEEVHIGCCHHHIDDEKENKWKKHLLHPLIHSLKIFIYIFIISVIFAFVIELIGEDKISSFLQSNIFLSPLLTTLIGLIPTCASSVIITELYVLNGIPFGALLSGLLMNAGLGLTYLFKNKGQIKNTLKITLICFIVSIIFGYLFSIPSFIY